MKFTKIYDLSEGQLLLTKETEDDMSGAENPYGIKCRTQQDSGDFAVTLGYSSIGKRDIMFDTFNKETVDMIMNMLLDISGNKREK
jgi:hypothetical protein